MKTKYTFYLLQFSLILIGLSSCVTTPDNTQPFAIDTANLHSFKKMDFLFSASVVSERQFITPIQLDTSVLTISLNTDDNGECIWTDSKITFISQNDTSYYHDDPYIGNRYSEIRTQQDFASLFPSKNGAAIDSGWYTFHFASELVAQHYHDFKDRGILFKFRSLKLISMDSTTAVYSALGDELKNIIMDVQDTSYDIYTNSMRPPFNAEYKLIKILWDKLPTANLTIRLRR
jgi:hypothetical protein